MQWGMRRVDDTRIKDSADTAFEFMREIFHGISRQQDDALLHTELSMAQVKALVAIGKTGEPPVGVVAKELNIGLSAASQIVERLVRAGLVERRPNTSDRRVIQCHLSDEGDQIWRKFRAGPQILRQWLQQLTVDELTALEKGLGALAQQVRNSRREGDDMKWD